MSNIMDKSQNITSKEGSHLINLGESVDERYPIFAETVRMKPTQVTHFWIPPYTVANMGAFEAFFRALNLPGELAESLSIEMSDMVESKRFLDEITLGNLRPRASIMMEAKSGISPEKIDRLLKQLERRKSEDELNQQTTSQLRQYDRSAKLVESLREKLGHGQHSEINIDEFYHTLLAEKLAAGLELRRNSIGHYVNAHGLIQNLNGVGNNPVDLFSSLGIGILGIFELDPVNHKHTAFAFPIQREVVETYLVDQSKQDAYYYQLCSLVDGAKSAEVMKLRQQMNFTISRLYDGNDEEIAALYGQDKETMQEQMNNSISEDEIAELRKAFEVAGIAVSIDEIRNLLLLKADRTIIDRKTSTAARVEAVIQERRRNLEKKAALIHDLYQKKFEETRRRVEESHKTLFDKIWNKTTLNSWVNVGNMFDAIFKSYQKSEITLGIKPSDVAPISLNKLPILFLDLAQGSSISMGVAVPGQPRVTRRAPKGKVKIEGRSIISFQGKMVSPSQILEMQDTPRTKMFDMSLRNIPITIASMEDLSGFVDPIHSTAQQSLDVLFDISKRGSGIPPIGFVTPALRRRVALSASPQQQITKNDEVVEGDWTIEE
jgi:hypothetical protein